jgi:hypothetical protein
MLVVWTAVIGVLSALIRVGVHLALQVEGPGADGPLSTQDMTGRLMFGLIACLVLSLGSLMVPALSATSVNGDRTTGVLATMQTTLLSPAEIAVGKLLAAWTTALALLVTASPFIGWAYLHGGTPGARLVATLGVLALTLLVVCAIGVGWSAVTSRTSSSTVLTYLTVAVLGPGLPLVFSLCLPLVQEQDTVWVRQAFTATAPEPPALAGDRSVLSDPGVTQARTCVESRQRIQRSHTERIWWLLAPSPYVVVADAGPRPLGQAPTLFRTDPLTLIRDGVREARLGPPVTENWCDGPGTESTERRAARQLQRDRLAAIWPYGLLADLLVGGVFVGIAVRRLRAPIGRLPRGIRVC